jgi:hypothetical protein
MKNTGAILVIALAIYITFISYMMFAVYGDPVIVLHISHFNGWINAVPLVWLLWVGEAVVDFCGLVVFTISGHGIPIWMNAFFTLPVCFGMGWLVLELIRG